MCTHCSLATRSLQELRYWTRETFKVIQDRWDSELKRMKKQDFTLFCSLLTVNLWCNLCAHQALPNWPLSTDSLVTVGIFRKKTEHKKTSTNIKIECTTSIHSQGCLRYPLHCNYVNGHIWSLAWTLLLLSLRECSNRPVTLTQFLKMQLPVEPTSLPAATGRRRKKAEGKRERKGKEQSRTGWHYLHILWLKTKTFELLQMGEEEETNKSHRCAAYISRAFQEYISPVCEQPTV